MIYKRLFLLSALAAGFALSASAQKKMYVLKDKKVVGVYPVSEIDSVTFALSGDVAGNTHAITAESDRFCSFSCPAEAAPGQTVIVYVKMENAKYKVSSLTANGKAFYLVCIFNPSSQKKDWAGYVIPNTLANF